MPLKDPSEYLFLLKAMTSSEAKRMWRQAIKEHWDNRCAYCGQNSDHLTLDHVHPKMKGGHDTTNNVVPACWACNQSKGSSHWLSWWIGQDSFDHSNFSKVLAWTTT
jgi:hypothetical protein